ncbi:MAG: DHHA1 domain-containing protein, partial [Planctomycetota bacterium]
LAEVDEARFDTMRNHTATHLLNWALREVLGEHVNQAGSVVAPDRLRFDFTHNKAVTSEQLDQVERMVNQRVLADEAVRAETLPLADAGKIPGVRAVFGEKYPDPVRVLVIGCEKSLAEASERTSAEFCGGTHLQRTSQVGLFKIVSEESIAKGIRRITALSGPEAVRYVQGLDQVVRQSTAALRVPPDQLSERIVSMIKEIKQLRKRGGDAAPAASEFTPDVEVATPDGPVLIGKVGTGDPAVMRNLCDQLRQKGAAAAMIGSVTEDKVTLIAMVSEKLVKAKKLKAGEWVKTAAALVGGSGGGKPTLAQAGGKLPDKLPEALKAAEKYIHENLM